MGYETELELQKVKRLSSISEDIHDLKNLIKEFVVYIKPESFESIIDLPKDFYGEIWSGNESRYVLDDEPMENCRFMDGLLWNGHDWFIFSQSADGQNWTLTECNKTKHYKPEEIR